MNANKISLNGKILIDLTADTAVEEDVAVGKTFHKADGTVGVGSAGPGAKLNIAYGDTAPEDTSKLWVKTSEPTNVIVSPKLEYTSGENQSFEKLTATLRYGGQISNGYQVGSKIYFVDDYGAFLESFDIETEAVAVEAEMTTGLNVMPQSIGIANGNVYFFSRAANATIGCYNIETSTFSTIGTVNWGSSCEPRVAVLGTTMYVIGAKVYILDTVTNEGRFAGAAVPENIHCYASICTIDKKIYLLGGCKNGNSVFNTEVYVFDTETEDLSALGATCENVFQAGACAIGNKIFLFGGGGNMSSRWSKTIKCFDIETKHTTTMEQQLDVYGCLLGSCAVGSIIYLCGGLYSPGNAIKSVYKFNTGVKILLESGVLQIKSTLAKNIFKIINADNAKVEIGVDKIYKGNTSNEGELVDARIIKNNTWIFI